MKDLKRLIKDLKESVSDRKLSRTDQLLLDILLKMTDMLISDLKEKRSLIKKTKRSTSNPLNQKEIRNEKVLSLQDFLRARGRPDRRE